MDQIGKSIFTTLGTGSFMMRMVIVSKKSKPWTEDEQKAAVKPAIDRLLYYGTLEQSIH